MIKFLAVLALCAFALLWLEVRKRNDELDQHDMEN